MKVTYSAANSSDTLFVSFRHFSQSSLTGLHDLEQLYYAIFNEAISCCFSRVGISCFDNPVVVLSVYFHDSSFQPPDTCSECGRKSCNVLSRVYNATGWLRPSLKILAYDLKL